MHPVTQNKDTLWSIPRTTYDTAYCMCCIDDEAFTFPSLKCTMAYTIEIVLAQPSLGWGDCWLGLFKLTAYILSFHYINMHS